MFLFKISLRNVFRNPKRSVLTVLTLIIGVMSYILAVGMVQGVEQSFMRADIATDTSHLQVLRKGYLKEEEHFPLDIALTNPGEVQKYIEKTWPKALVMPRIVFRATLTDGTHGLTIRGVALDVKQSQKIFNYAQYGQKKVSMAASKSAKIMLLGKSLARTFGKKIGDTMSVEVRTQTGSINTEDFKIYDILDSGSTLTDGFSLFIPLEAGRKLLEMKRDVTGLVVRFPHRDDAVPAAAALARRYPKLDPHTWIDKGRTIVELNKVRRQMFNVIILVIMLIAGAGLANTMLMAGFERKGEIGMMTAMGLQRKRIIGMFATEAGILGFFGSLVGAAIGGSLTYWLALKGLDISQSAENVGGSASSISYATILYWEFTVAAIVTGVVLGVVVATLSAIWPALRITKLEPRDILSGS